MQIQDSAIIVTGASAGIGRATAVSLAQEGANVVLNARRAGRLQTLADELSHLPGRRLVIPGDLRNESFARRLVEQTVNELGRLDVLINNAGLGHKSPVSQIPTGDVRTIFETNVFGLLAATQTAVAHMKQQNHGQIINISSIVSQRPLPQSGVYGASKTAVNFISRSLRMELQHTPIIVTLVYPGRTLTEFGEAQLGQTGANPSTLFRIPAERVAQAIVKAIRHGRTEVYVTWYDWLFTSLNRHYPRLLDRIFGSLVSRI